MSRFAGKTVLVTGGSRGLGSEIALAFGAAGAHVCVGYHRNQAAALSVAEKICQAGGTGAASGFDVADSQAVEQAVDALIQERGTIDVLCHSAGIVRDTMFALASQPDWEEPLRVNLGGALSVTRAVVRPMLAKRSGSIVFIGSAAGLRASPGQVGYSASKGGLLAATATLAAELAPRGIRVNMVSPGLIAAGMAQRLDRRIVAERTKQIPLARLGRGDEVANVVLFLASDAASYVVGQSISVDGGLTL